MTKLSNTNLIVGTSLDMTTFQGSHECPSGRFAVVAARFNQTVVDQLLRGTFEALRSLGVNDSEIDVAYVPGCFEIPLIAARFAESRRYTAVICLGAVIRGETDHYDYVCRAVTDGVAKAGIDSGIPVIFGILTCDTLEQAMRRAGPKSSNKGYDSALAAVEMVNLLRKLPQKG